MPTGSFDISYLPQALSAPAPQSQVARFDGSNYTALPNVVCLRIDREEGASPAIATFAYLMDDTLAFNLGWPSTVEAIFPLDAAPNPYVVLNDDRIVVLVLGDDGTQNVWFDGHAQIPECDVAEKTQLAKFSATSVTAREFDAPIKGRLQRSADKPTMDPSYGPIKTDLPCRFNPSDNSVADGNKGGLQANCTPNNNDVGQGDATISFPVFLDEGIEAIPAVGGSPGTPAPQTMWTISKSCRYLMSVGNPKETYVQNPDFSVLTNLLQANWPAPGTDVIGGDDQTGDIIVRDYDASDKAWPAAVEELLSYGGFGCSFTTNTDQNGNPLNELDIYRNDSLTTIAPKQIYLQPAGGSLGGNPNNATAFHITRDCNSVVNQYSIESPLKQVELSIILAPLYVPLKSDTATMNRLVYLKSSFKSTTTAQTRRAYRWYGADEIGADHWDIKGQVEDPTPFDFSGVFGTDSQGNPLWCKRYRPGAGSLISVDSEGHPLKADLSISFDYDVETNTVPGLWDGVSGHWFKINGGWKLLSDRLGIEVTVDDVELWQGGAATGKIAGVSWWADPTTVPKKDPGGNPTNGMSPVLRLTTVIEDDRMLSAIAKKRTASPTKFTRRRRADCRDHFQFNSILAGSMYNNIADNIGGGSTDVIARDDTKLALDHAYALRQKTEMPPVAGSITLDGILTDYYQLGDRISEIDGRNIGLQANINAGQGERPLYPRVVQWSSVFRPEIATILQLSDQRATASNL